jgi:hypothetical protein
MRCVSGVVASTGSDDKKRARLKEESRLSGHDKRTAG